MIGLKNNMRLTNQRQVILEELRKVSTHPTASEVYSMVRKRLPRIGLGTVYRNLELLSECGIIMKLEVGGEQKRFDGVADTHYHIRCVTCGKVADLEIMLLNQIEAAAAKISGYDVLNHHILFNGICSGCKET